MPNCKLGTAFLIAFVVINLFIITHIRGWHPPNHCFEGCHRFGGCWCVESLWDITWNIAPPFQLLCAWYVCMCVPGGCAAKLHETDFWPRDSAAIWLDLMCVVHDHTVVWLLRPVARNSHLTWQSAQLSNTDIWPGNLPSCTRQTFDLGICPVTRHRHLTWESAQLHETDIDTDIWPWEVAAVRLDYMCMCHLCVSLLDPRQVAFVTLPKLTTPIPLGQWGVLAAYHRCAQLILIKALYLCVMAPFLLGVNF